MDAFRASILFLVLFSVTNGSLAQSTVLPNGFPMLSEAKERQIRWALSRECYIPKRLYFEPHPRSHFDMI